jgi:hypothetical protein
MYSFDPLLKNFKWEIEFGLVAHPTRTDTVPGNVPQTTVKPVDSDGNFCVTFIFFVSLCPIGFNAAIVTRCDEKFT